MDSISRISFNNLESCDFVNLRILNSGDIAQFINLWDEAFSTDQYAFRTTKDKWDQKSLIEKKKNFEHSILKPNFILGAFSQSALIGMVGISQKESDFMLWGTFVSSTFRGENIGYSLVKKAIVYLILSNPNVDHLYLEVFSSAQAARSLYKKLGFIENETRLTGEIIATKTLR